MNEILNQLNRLLLHDSAQNFTIAKLEGNEVKYPHQKIYLIEADLIQAIEGKKTIGMMLAQDKTYLCKAGCIDIDCPRDAKDLSEGLALAQRLQEIALKLNLRAYIEFSGNRGYHLWIFANKPIYASLMQSGLKAIASQANFDCKEIFPNAIPETKCIKLPCSIHLKSGNRCGFIDQDFDPNNPQINLENQAKLMAEFEQNSLEDLTAVANLTIENSSNNSQVNQKEINQKLNEFGNNHPTCINYLLNNGSPLEVDYNQANLTLVRYSLSRNIELKEAIAFAELMAKNTSANHSTSKDYEGKVSNFKSAFTSASRNKADYEFSCSYVLANLNGQKLSTRGCIGSKCSLFKPNQNKSDKTRLQDFTANSSNNSFNNSSACKYCPLNQFIFEAMIKLSSEDKEVCKSLILAEVEILVKDYKPQDIDATNESIRLRESELLAYFFEYPELILDNLDLFSEGFIALTDLSNLRIGDYLDYISNLELPSEDTLEIHLEVIRQQGIKSVAKDNLESYKLNLEIQDPVDVLTTSIEDTENLLKRSLNDEQILPVSQRLSQWTLELFAEDKISIPTFSNDLNYLLNGGLSQGRFYVLGSPPANGKSTICLQLAEVACQLGFRVVYASYEMSASQIFITSLSRLGAVNSSLLESRKFNKDSKLKDSVINLISQYQEKIAPNLHIIEADDQYTPSRLLAIVKKLKADLLIVDYLQLMTTGDQKLDNAYQETLRVSKIATELKRLSRKANIPVIAISDITKNAYEQATSGNDLDMGALRDSFKIAHSADVIGLLMSNDIPKKVTDDDGNKVEKPITQLYILAEKMRFFSLELSQKIEMLAHEFRLDKSKADTYSRLIIAKNRTGKCGDILFRYSKAIHSFDSLNYLTDSVNFTY